MRSIEAIAHRRILNSHAAFTTEFVVTLDDGSVGAGASPQGETIGIYEDRKVQIAAADIVETVRRDGYLGKPLQQEDLDEYLGQKASVFGKNNCYALSLAFFTAAQRSPSAPPFGLPNVSRSAPRICCNILNGGYHAYTNPILTDFPEYLLVSTSNDIPEVVGKHNEIQRRVAEVLRNQPTTVVAGNPVSRFASADNRACIEFLLEIVQGLGYAHDFDLMIDASAGDLWTGRGYRLAITDGSARSSEEFCEYWLELLRQYPLRFLEDPLSEEDEATWSQLTTSQETCAIIGDNFYSSDAARIDKGAAKRSTHGVIIKPNQAGSVTAVCRAIETARRTGQIAITSHRSVSTESPFEAILTCLFGVEYIKVGPLLTDYSSVVRLNEIIRLTEE